MFKNSRECYVDGAEKAGDEVGLENRSLILESLSAQLESLGVYSKVMGSRKWA